MQDRFVAPKSTFLPTTNAAAIQAITPRHKNNQPSPSVVERLESEGNIRLAALLAAAQQGAKDNAKVIQQQYKPRASRVRKSTNDEMIQERIMPKEAAPKFKPQDVMSDKDFIRMTRDTNIHTSEMKSLFYANGGQVYLDMGLSYAQSYDSLRRDKMRSIKGEKVGNLLPYARGNAAPTGGTMTPGTPTKEELVRRQDAAMAATRVVANEKWAFDKKD